MDEQMIERAEKAIRDVAAGRSLPPRWQELVNATEELVAAHSVIAGKVAELIEAARPFAESIVIDPNKKRGERHWAIYGKPTNIDQVLRLQAALAPYPERRSE